MNYEQFFYWLEGHLAAFEIDENSEIGGIIYKKMQEMSGETPASNPVLPLSPVLPTMPVLSAEVSNDSMDDFLEKYHNLEEEEVLPFGTPTNTEQDWNDDIEKTDELKSPE